MEYFLFPGMIFCVWRFVNLADFYKVFNFIYLFFLNFCFWECELEICLSPRMKKITTVRYIFIYMLLYVVLKKCIVGDCLFVELSYQGRYFGYMLFVVRSIYHIFMIVSRKSVTKFPCLLYCFYDGILFFDIDINILTNLCIF